MKQARLTLDDPTRAVPRRPTLIYAAGGQAQLEAFDDAGELAARIAALNPEAEAFDLSAEPWPQAYPGLDVFFGWSVYRVAAGLREWVGVAAFPEPEHKDPARRAALQAALDALRSRRAAA